MEFLGPLPHSQPSFDIALLNHSNLTDCLLSTAITSLSLYNPTSALPIMTDLQVWEEDPALYVFTSLTAGSSHIVTATSRIETILRANRIPFSYIDTATNDSAKMLYQRRGKGKKLPFLVKEGFVIGVSDDL